MYNDIIWPPWVVFYSNKIQGIYWSTQPIITSGLSNFKISRLEKNGEMVIFKKNIPYWVKLWLRNFLHLVKNVIQLYMYLIFNHCFNYWHDTDVCCRYCIWNCQHIIFSPLISVKLCSWCLGQLLSAFSSGNHVPHAIFKFC